MEELIQFKDAIVMLGTTGPTFYKHLGKLGIEPIKKDGNLCFITKENLGKVSENLKKTSPQNISRGAFISEKPQESKIEKSIIEENEKLQITNGHLQTQIKEYGEHLMNYKSENKELKEKNKELEEKVEKVYEEKEKVKEELSNKLEKTQEEKNKEIIKIAIKKNTYQITTISLVVFIIIAIIVVVVLSLRNAI